MQVYKHTPTHTQGGVDRVPCMGSALQGPTWAAKIRLGLERGGFPLSGAQKSTKS